MILILYVESGTGSFTLAKSVQQELTKRRVESRLISLHDLLPSWLNHFLFGRYKEWCIASKQHFRYIYRSRWFYPFLYKMLPLIIRCRGSGVDNLSLFNRVEAVISCSFFCGWFASYWKKGSGKQYKTFGILGDYSVSPGWQLQVDKLFIPFDFQNPVFDFIRRRGGDITVTGIPVNCCKTNSARIKGSVLLCGGGWGLQITEETISALLMRKSVTKLIVLCGQNTTLYEKVRLQFHACISRGKLEVHGFTDDMCAIYARTDIVVTKAGGLTMTEAAIFGKPLIITGYLPGHEEANMQVFVQRGAALFAGDTDTLCRAIDNVLSSNASAELLIKNAALLVNHQACNRLCNEIMEDIKYVDS